jgi:hypothetical protein
MIEKIRRKKMSNKKKVREVENALDNYKEACHPLQPLITDNQGVVRFKENAIVRYLLDYNGNPGTKIDLNTLATLPFTQEDREQFAQLIGYSLNGFSELSYVSRETYEIAVNQKIYPKQKEKPRKTGTWNMETGLSVYDEED